MFRSSALPCGSLLPAAHAPASARNFRGLGEMMENADWKLERFDIDPDKVQFKMIDNDVAVVAYEVDEKMIVDGKPTNIRAYDTSVWVRKLGKWVCAMHTETLAGDPFGRDRVAH